MSTIHLSIVTPVYRAQSIVHELVTRIIRSVETITPNYEIILVEDNSPDDSWGAILSAAANNPKVKGIKLSRNFGQHAAISAGLHHSQGQWIVVMDCDLQDDPAEIPRLYSKAMENAGYDIVLAKRVERQDNFIKRFFSKSFYKMLSYLTGAEQDHTVANFGIYSRKTIDSVLAMGDYVKYFPSMVRWVGHKMTTLEVKHAERYEGESSYNLMRLIGLAINVILSFSVKPLMLVTRFGLLISLLAFIFVIYNIIQYLRGEIVVLGYTSLISSVWFLSGLIITTVGIVGMYVGRIFDQTKQRPVFIITQAINFDNILIEKERLENVTMNL